MPENEEVIPVNITIADRTYRVKIAPKDEEAVRKTAHLINQKMVEFKNAYAGKDMQLYFHGFIVVYHRARANRAEPV